MHAHMVRLQLQQLTAVKGGTWPALSSVTAGPAAAHTFSGCGVTAGLPSGSNLSHLMHLVGAAAFSAAVLTLLSALLAVVGTCYSAAPLLLVPLPCVPL